MISSHVITTFPLLWQYKAGASQCCAHPHLFAKSSSQTSLFSRDQHTLKVGNTDTLFIRGTVAVVMQFSEAFILIRNSTDCYS